MTRKFETFDHTGDIGVRVTADTLEDLFAEAAVALTEAVTDAASIEPRETKAVSVTAASLDLLLLDFLSEVLFRFDSDGWIAGRAEVVLQTDRQPVALDGRLFGEPFDASRHAVRVLVKAVTYHGLEVRREGDRWIGTVIFDI